MLLAAAATENGHAPPQKHLFIDRSILSNMSNGAALVAHRPHKIRLGVTDEHTRADGRVLWPTEEWESISMGGYATVLQAPTGEYRYYYECSGGTKGGGNGGKCCVALS